MEILKFSACESGLTVFVSGLFSVDNQTLWKDPSLTPSHQLLENSKKLKILKKINQNYRATKSDLKFSGRVGAAHKSSVKRATDTSDRWIFEWALEVWRYAGCFKILHWWNSWLPESFSPKWIIDFVKRKRDDRIAKRSFLH